MKGAVLLAVAAAGVFATTTAAPTTLAATAAVVTPNDVAFNGTDETTPTRHLAAYRSYRMVGVDILGDYDVDSEPLPSPHRCFLYCEWLVRGAGIACGAATWTNHNGGTCWIKSTRLKGAPSAPKVDAESFIFLGDSINANIWSATRDGFDMVGNDLTTTNNRPGMRECMKDCEANKECFAVTWTSYNKGTCWLKRRASAYVAKAGALSAYVAKEYNV